MIHARPQPALYARAQSPEQRTINATYGRELLRVLGGLPDPPERLDAARADLLIALAGVAARKAHGARDVAVALELRGRRSEAYIVRRWAGIAGGLERLREHARTAAKAGGHGHVTARALRWALTRL